MIEKAQEDTNEYIVVGKVSSAHGIKGWIKIYSFTDPMDNILHYQPWLLRGKAGEAWRSVNVQQGRVHGRSIVAQIEGVDERDSAEQLKGSEIAITRQQLPVPDRDEFYWIDLIGLRVINQQGVVLGTVDHLMETGANDVLVIKGDKERLVPFVMGEFVKQVDLENQTIVVDWDAEF